MSPTKFSFRQCILVIFQPLIKHPFQTVSASVIIGLALYVGTDIFLAELIRQNSYGIQMLSIEMLIEHGPEYATEGKKYVEVIDQYYIKHLEQRKLAGILRFLYPSLSPQKILASTKEALEKAAEGDEEEAKEAIRQAGQVINQLFQRSERFPRSPVRWFESEHVPDWSLTDLDDAFDTFHDQINELENAQTLNVAEDECRISCRYGRRALLLLFLARLGYDNEEQKIERFLSDTRKAVDLELNFEETYPTEKQLFCNWAKNMELRAKVVESMLSDDMDRACMLLRETFERALKAFEEEKGNPIE